MSRNYQSIWMILVPLALGCQSGPFSGWTDKLTQVRPVTTHLPERETQAVPAPLVTDSMRMDVMLAAAKSYENEQRFPDALRAYERILEVEPRQARACHRSAVCYDRMGRPDLAVPLYHRALELAPHDPSLLIDHGYSRYLQGDFAAGERSLRQAVTLQPSSRRARLNLGLLLARTNREAEAREMFHKSGLSEAESHNNVAFALSLNRRVDEAAEQYSQAVQLDPKLTQARQSSQELQRAMSKMQEANPVVPASYEAPLIPIRQSIERFPDLGR